MHLLSYLDCSFVLLSIYLAALFLRKKRRAPLPPGPRGLPILGNLLDMPTEREWLTFSDWKTQYGDIISVSVFSQTLIIVNSARIAAEMLEKRIYADRSVLQMGGELVGWKNTLVLTRYGPRFRNSRKMAHQLFGTHATMEQFLPIEEKETHSFLQRLLDTPDDFVDHIRKTAGAIILKISYGYQVQDGHDPFVTLADEAVEQFSMSTSPGFLINLFPILRFVPESFPGGGFHTIAREWAKSLQDMVEQPFNLVKEQMKAGTHAVSFTSKLLEAGDISPEDEFDIKWTAASLYSGGADTTVSAIHAFFKAMALYPEVQAAAQAELLTVVGEDRLPTFSDRDNLPYLNALALEVLRWHSVVPTGIPHRVMEDNIHEEYFIPAGAAVIPNVWQMTHDEAVYQDPMQFQPARFLKTDPDPDPRNIVFGWGRRICPGKILADASVFISCAMVLSVFQISEPPGHQIVHEQNPGTISHPSSFKCDIKVRSDKALALIRAV